MSQRLSANPADVCHAVVVVITSVIIFAAVVIIATTGALRRVAMTTSLSAIPTFLSRGEEGKEKTLRRTTHGIHPPLPIVLPPRVLIHRYSASDYVRCRKEDDASSPPFPGRALSPRRNDCTLPPAVAQHSEVGARWEV